MSDLSKKWCVVMVVLILCSCGQRDGLAPVVELKWHELNSHARQHVVERGETLYAIAFRYDQDYRQLALANRLSSPYTLRVGQKIRLRPFSEPVNFAAHRHQKPIQYIKPQWPTRVLPIQPPLHQYSSGWLWPVHGRIAANFVPQQGKKGIDIAGKKGEKIHASRGGVVAYAGNGLCGYGNLIIIKHDNQFLTAY